MVAGWWSTVAGLVALGQVGGAEPVAVPLPLGGEVIGIVAEEPAAGGIVRVQVPVFAEPLELPAGGPDRSPATQADGDAPLPDLVGLPGRVGLLTAEGMRIVGCLADCGDGRIGWQPLGGPRAIPFAAGAAARIDYRGLDAVGGPGVVLARRGAAEGWQVVDVMAGGPAARDGRLRVGDLVETCADGAHGRPVALRSVKAESLKLLLVGPVGSVVRLGVARDDGDHEITVVRDPSGLDDLAGAARRDVLDRASAVRQSLSGAASGGPATVHLRSGESFTCSVIRGDATGVRLRLGADREVEIPGESLRAIELSSAGVRPILKQKLARLLTLPRSQQAAPPTHVVRLAWGDYLRGRLVGIDATTVRFDVLGDVKNLPRRDVARIIRLAPADAAVPSLADDLAARGGLPLVVVGGDGRRLAVAATGLTGGEVVGTSPTLGPTSVSLAAAATVLVGEAIDEVSAAELPYAQWVLAPAGGAARNPAARP
jgi:hypothetical protein